MRVRAMRWEGVARRAATCVLCVLVLALTACAGPVDPGSADDPAQPDPAELEGRWELASGTGPDGEVELVETHPVTLEIAGERWSGTAACNSYDAEVTLEGDRIDVGGLAATEMACMEEGVMESEAAFLAALPDVETWSVRDAQLVLEGPETELVFQGR